MRLSMRVAYLVPDAFVAFNIVVPGFAAHVGVEEGLVHPVAHRASPYVISLCISLCPSLSLHLIRTRAAPAYRQVPARADVSCHLSPTVPDISDRYTCRSHKMYDHAQKTHRWSQRQKDHYKITHRRDASDSTLQSSSATEAGESGKQLAHAQVQILEHALDNLDFVTIPEPQVRPVYVSLLLSYANEHHALLLQLGAQHRVVSPAVHSGRSSELIHRAHQDLNQPITL